MIMKGQKINDRYQIIKTIGEGGMANVYLAYDTILDRNVAVKVLRGDLATDEKFVRRFQREALSASSLSHPNIVEVYDVGEDNGSYYIVMEYIEGKHLKQLLKKRGNLTLTEVVDIMLQVTDGMSAAHDLYIIHRDIKPQNIMILENGLIKITDFGIAMALNSTQLTQTNSVMGSVHYLPPEQASGKGATIQSDIYSMGILMYELLTGSLPFRGDNAVEIALKHIKEDFPSIKEKIPSLPQSIENIILRATAKNVKNRYADAKEMHDDLKTALTDARAGEPKIQFTYTNEENELAKKKQELTEEEKIEEFAEIKKVEPKKDIKKKKKDEFDFDDKKENDDDVKATQIIDTDLKKKENKFLLILAIIFTSMIVIVTTVFFLIQNMPGEKDIEVPNVTGYSVKDAEKALKDAGFEIAEEYQEKSSLDIEAGKVVKTSPEAGSPRKKGAVITIFVSIGDNGYTVTEDLIGTSAEDVKNNLPNIYGIFVRTKYEPNDVFNAGEIIRVECEIGTVKSECEFGTVLHEGDTLIIYLPDMTADFPDFTQGEYTLKQIEEWCKRYSITFDPQYVPNDEYQAGTIFDQNQKPGTTASPGKTLTIRIAEEPEPERPAEEIDSETIDTE